MNAAILNHCDLNAVKAFALESFRFFLGGVWETVDENEFDICRLSGGLSNYLYLCSLCDASRVTGNEPFRVLLRIYGDNYAKNISTEKDVVVTALMACHDIGPKLYGILSIGRIEEFIPSKTLTAVDLHEPRTSAEIARVLAKFHALEMPFVKQPSWFFNTIESNLLAIESLDFYKDENDRKKLQELKSYDFNGEYDFLKNQLSLAKSPVVFCHNDFQATNLLKSDGTDPRIILIDYEYANYNFRGFDIGNIFCEWMMVNDHPEPPYFKCNPSSYPNREEQLNFLRAYLNVNALNKEDEEKLLFEANCFALACHFFWSLWCACQEPSPNVQFKYLDYALIRMGLYRKQKEQLISGLIPSKCISEIN